MIIKKQFKRLPEDTLILSHSKQPDLSHIHEYINTETIPTLIIDKDLDVELIPILRLGGASDDISLLKHPTNIQLPTGKEAIVYDLRTVIDVNRTIDSVSYKVRLRTEYLFTSLRAYLEAQWISASVHSSFDRNYKYAGALFSNWIANLLKIRFDLDIQSQVYISILAHYYYQCLFIEEKSEVDNVLMGAYTANVLRLEPRLCMDLVDNLKKIISLNDLMSAIKDKIPDRRLNKQTDGSIYEIINGAWIGANANEVLAVGLEYPPTWLAIAYIAVTENSAARYGIGNYAKQYRNNNLSEFLSNMKELISYITIP